MGFQDGEGAWVWGFAGVVGCCAAGVDGGDHGVCVGACVVCDVAEYSFGHW